MVTQEYGPEWRGLLNKRLHSKLRTASGGCYAYPQHEIYLSDKGTFLQTRSGPNWQGGVLTLATCKHYLRSTRPAQGWPGTWLAGFTPKINGENYLLYVAQVALAFENNQLLGDHLRKYDRKAYTAKNAFYNVVGDVYPCNGPDAYDLRNYAVHPEHVRQELKKGAPKWHSDINYKRPAPVFIMGGYLYSRPMYRVTRPLHRSGWKCDITELFNYLEEV